MSVSAKKNAIGRKNFSFYFIDIFIYLYDYYCVPEEFCC